MDAFDELLGVGLVRPTDVPRRFRFRHPLVRRAVYESTPGGWLLGAHARAAQSLTERGAPAAARAHHVEFAARPGDVAAVAVLAEAGMASLLRAPASAARWLSAALRILPADAPAEQRVGLLAHARPRAGRAGPARREPRRSRGEHRARADPSPCASSSSRRAPGVERLLGRHDEAHARLLTCLGQLPEQTAADAISLMLELAIDALFRSDFASMLEWADRAQVAAQRAGRSPADRGDGGDHDAGVRRGRPHPARPRTPMPRPRRWSPRCPTPSSATAATRSPTCARRARSWIATTRRARTASARCSWGAPPVTCTRRCSRRSARRTSCAGAWPRRRTCSTPAWKRRGSPGITQSTAWMLRNQALLAVAIG